MNRRGRPVATALAAAVAAASLGTAGAARGQTGGASADPEAFVVPAMPVMALPPDEPAAAADPTEPLVALALANHPTLRQAGAAVDYARGMQYQVTRRPNPTVGYTASEIGSDGTAGQQGAYLAREFVTGGKRQLAGGVYRWQAASAAAIRDTQRLRVISGVRTTYWRLIAARRNVALLGELAELLEETRAMTRQLFEAGELAVGPVLQAQVEAGRTGAALAAARRAADAAERRLAVAVGVPADALPPIQDADWPARQPLDWSLWPSIEASSPELVAADAAVERARWALRQAEAQVIPNLNTQFSIQHDAAADEMLAGVQMGVALPVNDRRRGAVAAARAELARACADRDRRRLHLQDRLVDQLRQYNAAVDQLRITETELLPAANENFETLRNAFERGEVDFLDLLTAQRTLLEIRQSTIGLRLEAAESLVMIDSTLVAESLDAPEIPGGF